METFNNPFSLKGKRILVTGASSGIGQQIAKSCAASGAELIVSGRNEERLQQTLEALPRTGHKSLMLDLANDIAVKVAVENLGKIDGLVHSAGYAALSPLRLATRVHIESQMTANVSNPALLTQQLLLRNAINSNGSIIFISSISAHIGVHGVSAYSASKAAEEALVRCLALEVAKKGIRVNCLAPGFVKTPMFEAMLTTTGGVNETIKRYPLGIGNPEDVANSVIFFLSPASRWITGTTLILDGGHTVG